MEAEKIKTLIAEKKRKEAEEIRKQRINNEARIVQAKIQHNEDQKLKSQKVKIAESSSAVKIKEYYQVKAEIIREERERMLLEEEARIMEKEKEIEKLGKREDVLLQNVNDALDNENKAQCEFEDISTKPVEELTEKYYSYVNTEHNYSTSKKWPINTSPNQDKSMSFHGWNMNKSKSPTSAKKFQSQNLSKLSYLSN